MLKVFIFLSCKCIPLADPGGAAGACPPTGSNSFIFTYVFAEKHLRRRSAPPPQQLGTPQREILDSQLYTKDTHETEHGRIKNSHQHYVKYSLERKIDGLPGE